MAMLIQEVEGERFGQYYLPHAAGVAFSRNLYRWAPQIRARRWLYAPGVGLGHARRGPGGQRFPSPGRAQPPPAAPVNEPKSIRRYSQQYIDLIDLEDNDFKTLPVREVLDSCYPPLRYIAQIDEDGYFASLRSHPDRTTTRQPGADLR